ncbi:regulatory factor X-associated protein [Dromaius novaehollandiae]|uniref:regulatory factor X-associated protein n=1 Tax=Dromaius novaehollandiae TaxID=8790 RepID=UPI0031205411
MQPCGGGEEEAAAGAVLPLPGGDPPLPAAGSGGLMFFYELGPGDGEAEEGEAAGGESTASPEELEEEEAAAGGEAAAAGGGCKSCTYQGCSETTTQVAKQRKPWMCKRHRNKMYKDKYKRKKSDQALGGGGAAGAGAAAPPRAEDCVEGSVSVTKQRTGSIGDRPARPTLLEQVLNQKRLVHEVVYLTDSSPECQHSIARHTLAAAALQQQQQQQCRDKTTCREPVLYTTPCLNIAAWQQEREREKASKQGRKEGRKRELGTGGSHRNNIGLDKK